MSYFCVTTNSSTIPDSKVTLTAKFLFIADSSILGIICKFQTISLYAYYNSNYILVPCSYEELKCELMSIL